MKNPPYDTSPFQSARRPIPKDFAFKGISEVSVRKEGDKLILEPIRKSWTSFAAAGNADQDFMTDRPDLMDVERVKF